MVKVCPKCGTSVNDDKFLFCKNCGTQLPRHISELKTSDRSFRYSILYYLVIYSDLLLCFIFGIGSIGSYLDVSAQNYHNPGALYLFLVYLSNFSLDSILIKNKKKTPNGIDSRICWIKGLIGVAGILTIISGLYFIIISVKMHPSNNANMDRHRQLVRIENVQEIETERNKNNIEIEDLQKLNVHTENNAAGNKEATDNASKILNPLDTTVNIGPDTLIKKEQNVPKIISENPIYPSVSIVKTKPEELVRTIVRPHPVLIINSTPSNRGESIPLQDKLISKEPIQVSELIDYSETATFPKTLEDLFEPEQKSSRDLEVIKPLKEQEEAQIFIDVNLPDLTLVPIQVIEPTTTYKKLDYGHPLVSPVKSPSIGSDNAESLTKDIDFSIIQESEEIEHPDPDDISIDWEEVGKKRREHNNNKSKMEVMLGQYDDVLSDEIELTSSPPKEKPAINQNHGYILQFPSDTLKRLDSRYYPVLKNIEGLTEISTENFTKILIQSNLGPISLTPTLDDINEWAEEVLNFENPLLEIRENTIRINMK